MNSIRRELHSRGMCSVCICELVKLASATECHSLGRKVVTKLHYTALSYLYKDVRM